MKSTNMKNNWKKGLKKWMTTKEKKLKSYKTETMKSSGCASKCLSSRISRPRWRRKSKSSLSRKKNWSKPDLERPSCKPNLTAERNFLSKSKKSLNVWEELLKKERMKLKSLSDNWLWFGKIWIKLRSRSKNNPNNHRKWKNYIMI